MGGKCNTNRPEFCNTKFVWEEVTEAQLKDVPVDDRTMLTH